MKMKFSEKEIPVLASKILNKILNNKNEGASVLALHGDLGAGKTTLTKEIAKQFRIKEKIISPTFVIMKIYKINLNCKFKKLIHIDAYRLDSHSDLLNIGWDKIIKDKDNLIILEWPEKVKKLILKDFIKVEILHIDEKNRMIHF